MIGEALQLSETAPGTLRSVVVVAVSAGGVGALLDLVASLPRDLDAAIIVVQHRSAAHASRMVALLRHRTALSVDEVEAGARLAPGHVFLAPPGHHLVVDRLGTLQLLDSPKVHHLRPAADVLFQSAADHYGDRVLAVVLSGSGSDGAGGVQAVKAAGGRVLIQEPLTAGFPGMPLASVSTGCADEILPPADLGPAISTWTRRLGAA